MIVQRMDRRLEGERVAGKGTRRAAKHVARKLIEHQDARQAGARAVEPAAIRGELVMQGEETPRYFGIECRIFLEPALAPLAVAGAFAEPEAKHLVRMLVCHCDKC